MTDRVGAGARTPRRPFVHHILIALTLAAAAQIVVLALLSRLLPVDWLLDVAGATFCAVAWSYRPDWQRPGVWRLMLPRVAFIAAAWLVGARLLIPHFGSR